MQDVPCEHNHCDYHRCLEAKQLVRHTAREAHICEGYFGSESVSSQQDKAKIGKEAELALCTYYSYNLASLFYLSSSYSVFLYPVVLVGQITVDHTSPWHLSGHRVTGSQSVRQVCFTSEILPFQPSPPCYG